MKKIIMGSQSSCTISYLLIEVLTEKIVTAALRETDFEDQHEGDQFTIFGSCRPAKK